MIVVILCFLPLMLIHFGLLKLSTRDQLCLFLKAHELAQASMSDCITETFSAIRTVSPQQFIL